MKNGIPFDVAFGLDDITRTAWGLVLAEMCGREFDWDRMVFKESGND